MYTYMYTQIHRYTHQKKGIGNRKKEMKKGEKEDEDLTSLSLSSLLNVWKKKTQISP